MRFVALTLLGLAGCLVGCTDAKKAPPKELRIGVTKRADPCTQRATKGDRLSMHYDGELWSNGEKFDSSRDRDSPFEFVLGEGSVIKGWDKGILGMCVGEQRRLTIPPELAYGSESKDKIPADSTLVFKIELLKVLGKAPPKPSRPDYPHRPDYDRDYEYRRDRERDRYRDRDYDRDYERRRDRDYEYQRHRDRERYDRKAKDDL